MATPSPDTDPILKHFAEAYRRTAQVETSGQEWPWHADVLHMHRPVARLGSLVWRRVEEDDIGPKSHDISIKSNIALMRKPRLVVQYLPVRDDPEGLSTVGVFVADGNLNDDFARAEPVAHNEWAPSNMAYEKGKPNPVKRALELIKQTFVNAAVIVPPGQGSAESQHGLVHLATVMGDLVAGTGDAARTRPGPSPKGATPKVLTARVLSHPQLKLENGRACAVFTIDVNVPSSAELPVRVSAEPYVLTEAGKETADGLEQPDLISWEIPEGVGRVARNGILLEQCGEHRICLTVGIPPDTAVSLKASAREAGSAS